MDINVEEIHKLESERFSVYKELVELERGDFDQKNGQPPIAWVVAEITRLRQSLDKLNEKIWQLRGWT